MCTGLIFLFAKIITEQRYDVLWEDIEKKKRQINATQPWVCFYWYVDTTRKLGHFKFECNAGSWISKVSYPRLHDWTPLDSWKTRDVNNL